jgi:Type I site-specific restriction-modification system, R (restriction) subunit and related helicases
MSAFVNELNFEHAVVNRLAPHKGWSPDLLKYQTEQQILENWANILFQNNKGRDSLNGQPLTKGEMDNILGQLSRLKTPDKIHGFINGKSIQITRDNPKDTLHFGKEISLKIYNRSEIAGGQSTYQISEQPVFAKHHPLLNERRGDFTLLINGMPVIHVEIKKDKDFLSQGINQIEKYTHERVFTGVYSLVQIFVVMTPDETIYFANPGYDGQFLHEFMFHWADFNNEQVNDWEDICEQLLSIPMAHQMIGFYSVADGTDGKLKVLRSYQIDAVKEIAKKVASTVWDSHDNKGGYIWHTTGSGKTLTSFKAAQLIAASNDADKVVFLMDRIELGTQSLDDYKNFADDNETVTGTESSFVLLGKLLSTSPDDTLIVTSIQKLAIISQSGFIGPRDLDKIAKKRVVIVVDECHRSTFGDMMTDIKKSFSGALFFGFSGTPIQNENKHKGTTTSEVFGDELHRYTIADGIRDGNVLGFDPAGVYTFSDHNVQSAVALAKAKAATVAEALGDPAKKAVYLHFMNEVKMTGHFDGDKYIPDGIEDEIPDSQYTEPTQKHKKAVVQSILEDWETLSLDRFHAILATSSINEAIEYYQLFKAMMGKEGRPSLNVTAVFDPNIDNNGGATYKEDGLVEILNDYNGKYLKHYTIPTADIFKRDVCLRLAHKRPYEGIDGSSEQRLDLVIVVDQLLTGFDSKWVNSLYLDKMLRDEYIIQAFSRTNRLFNKQEKPHGIIKMFRRPHTMELWMNRALSIYSWDKPYGVFVDKLEKNLGKLYDLFSEIKEIFDSNGIKDFDRLPESAADKAMFSKKFRIFNCLVATAKIQGLDWDKKTYSFKHEGAAETSVALSFGKEEHLALLQRYKELKSGATPGPEDPPYDIDTSITEIPTGLIDAAFMESKFMKFLVAIHQANKADQDAALDELHKSFSTLTQDEQKQASIIIQDIYTGILVVDPSKTIKDYLGEYLAKIRNTNIKKMSDFLGISEDNLRKFVDEAEKSDLDSFGRLTLLKSLVDKQILREKLQKKFGKPFSIPKTNIELDKLIRSFIEVGGFDIDDVP